MLVFKSLDYSVVKYVAKFTSRLIKPVNEVFEIGPEVLNKVIQTEPVYYLLKIGVELLIEFEENVSNFPAEVRNDFRD